jgi:hypothetical protein
MSSRILGGRAATVLVGTAAIAFASIAWTGGVAAQAPQGQQPAAPAGRAGGAAPAGGQQGRQGGGAAPQAPQTPQAAAAIDLTGNWVSVVNEDWRWRMITPPKGDYASVPLTDEGRKMADAWQPAMDGQCQAYGVGGIMRMPTRLRISWQDPQTLKIETDAGTQTRLLQFDPNAAKPTTRSLQGFTVAEWERPGGAGRGRGPLPAGGNLKAVTTMHTGGWLRKNGVPYTENAEITEYFDRFEAPNGDQWFSVTTIVRDPRVLNQEFVTSSHFKKEADGSKWSPSSCRQASS